MLNMKTKRCNLLWHQAAIIVVSFFLCVMTSGGCRAQAGGGADTLAVRLESQLVHGAAVRSAVFSPDGRTVLTTAGSPTARLWETATGREVRRFEGHEGMVASAVFSSDGRTVLTASWD